MKIDKLLKGGALASLAAVMAISPVWAYVGGEDEGHGDSTGGGTTSSTQDATVTYSGSSTYTVNIPQTITLGSDKTGTYSVNITGDLASGATVSITPAASFQMTATGKDPVTATVTQETTSWTMATLGTAATGTIEAEDLSAGEWTGTLTFTISASSSSGGDIVGNY